MGHVRTVAGFLRRHWIITILVAAGTALRVLAILAYRPAILYVDSIYFYLNHLPGSTLPGATWPSPDPLGYNMLLLQPILSVGNLFTVVLVQHLLGLGTATLIYTVAVRRRIPRALAALAAAPLLLDAYQIYVEHMIMSDPLFEALLGAGIAALLWNRRPGPIAIALAGLSLGAATTVRIVGLPVLLIFMVYLAVAAARRSLRFMSVALVALSFLVPVLGYQLYTATATRQFGAARTTASTLYARAATFVDCDTLNLPDDERQLCPIEPLDARRSPDFYANNPQSPIYRVRVPAGTTLSAMEKDFALRAMTGQPIRLTTAVLTDAARLFTWDHDNLANPDAPAERFRFQKDFPLYPNAVTMASFNVVSKEYGGGPPTGSAWAAGFLRGYQLSVGYTPGPYLLLCLLAAIGAVAGLGRWRGAPNRSAAFLALAAAIFVVGAADFYEFSWRYQLPALVLLPLAGVLGVSTIAYRPPAGRISRALSPAENPEGPRPARAPDRDPDVPDGRAAPIPEITSGIPDGEKVLTVSETAPAPQ